MISHDPEAFRGEAEKGYAWSVGCVFMLIGLLVLGVWGIFFAGYDVYSYIQSSMRPEFDLREFQPVIRYPLDLLIWIALAVSVLLAGVLLRIVLTPFFPDTRFELDAFGFRICRGRRTIKSVDWNREYRCIFYRPAPLIVDGEEDTPDFTVIVVEQEGSTITVWLPYFPSYIPKERRAALPKWPDESHWDIEIISPGALAIGYSEILQSIELHRRLLTLGGYPPPKGWLEKLGER